MFSKLKKPFIDLTNQNINNPQYVSFLYVANNHNHHPIFLNQKINQIRIEYFDCNCGKSCFICKKKMLRISKNNNVRCVLFDPYMRYFDIYH